MFTVEKRDRVRDHLLAMAQGDPRVVAGAMVGALANGGGDRWSDLDLTFGLADRVSASDVLTDWTAELSARFSAVHLFDLPFLSSIYRVFLLPGILQVDLSFTPGSEFGALGPRFELLFGTAVERGPVPRASAHHLFGLGAHHAVRARFSIERGRLWQAEHWISGVRDQALALACRRRGLPADNGRGFDELPPELLALAGDALVCSVERGELLRALDRAVEALLREAEEVREVASQVEIQLRGLRHPIY
jgi:hypothetical protein